MFCPETFPRTHEALDVLHAFFKDHRYHDKVVHLLTADANKTNHAVAALILALAGTCSEQISHEMLKRSAHGEALYKVLYPGQIWITRSDASVLVAVMKLEDGLVEDCA